MNDVLVTVVCLAYNHGKYIRRALDGFVNQKTDFKYQVIVHDDASPDNTAKVLAEYVEKYPDIIRPIYQTENQYSKKIGITNTFILPLIQGKYVALCEGDDYWTDDRKLQKQVDALEANPDCYFCVHKVSEVYENENNTGYFYPKVDIEAGVIKPNDFLNYCKEYPFHTSCYFFRAQEYLEYRRNPPEFAKICPVGDEAYLLHFGQLGNVYYINEEMSCYRRGVESSWSKNHHYNIASEKSIRHQEKMYNTLVEFDKYTNYAFHEICLERESRYFARAMILGCQTKEYFKPEYRELFRKLSINRKLFVFIAALFPEGAKRMYVKRISIIKDKHGI